MRDNKVAIADELFDKANKLRANYPFQKLAIERFGNIHFVGSSITNLMTDPDIDSNILVPDIRNKKGLILDFVESLTEIKECRKICLYNRLYEATPCLIINVERFVFEDETWTITFFFEESDFQGSFEMTNRIEEAVANGQRNLILELKDYRLKEGLKRKIPSALLYEAVIDHGIKNTNSFKSFLAGKGIDLTPEGTD